MRPFTVYSAIDKVAAWLLPPRCVLCGGRGQPEGLDLCVPCQRELPWLERGCGRCGLPPAGAVPAGDTDPLCSNCCREPPPHARCHAPFRYEFPLTRLVPTLKYEGALANARVLGLLLARSVERAGLHRGVDALVPMPLHSKRLQSRGFNQSREIAVVVARALQLPVVSGALRRTIDTASQVGLDRAARQANVSAAFRAEPQIVQRQRLALLDDVVTTGSTARAAARSLLDAGAQCVEVWCVARAEG